MIKSIKLLLFVLNIFINIFFYTFGLEINQDINIKVYKNDRLMLKEYNDIFFYLFYPNKIDFYRFIFMKYIVTKMDSILYIGRSLGKYLTESYGVVGYHICFTRKRSWVRNPVALLFIFIYYLY